MRINFTGNCEKCEICGLIFFSERRGRRFCSKKCASKLSNETALERNLRRKYAISTYEYNEMFNLQKGCCLICGKHQSELKKALSVDHDHITGKVRGLLCPHCNFAIGLFHDSIENLNSAIIYLNNSK